jgi:GDP-L-fucose synthase
MNKTLSLLFVIITFNINSEMNFNSKIYVAGHKGLVGSAIFTKLKEMGFTNIITKTSTELDLQIQSDVESFFEKEKPEYVFLAAAKVGGIKANMDYPAQFIYNNIAINTNVIHAAYKYSVKKLLFLGSSCIYPRICLQPIKEEYLLESKLEPTNEPYAIAKIAGIRMCQAYNKEYGTKFISCMPTNLYGPNDNFNLETSHVLPALISRIYKAKEENAGEVKIWGTGKAKREFLYVDDLAEACIFLMQNYNDDLHINIGTGQDVTITQLAEYIKEIIGFKGLITYDSSKPDGTPRKLLDVTRINNLGWKASLNLYDGLKKTIKWYIDNVDKLKN